MRRKVYHRILQAGAWYSPDLKASVLGECPNVSKFASAGVKLSLKTRRPGVEMPKGRRRTSLA